jgi:sulfite oxidase
MIQTIQVSRRSLLAGGSALVAGAALRPDGLAAQDATLPEYVDFKVADALIIHSDNTIETRRDAFGTALVTPETKLYIRNNVAPPPAVVLEDRDAWAVSIEGVANPRTVTVGELKGMGLDSVAMVLQCSGNGRAFFDHETSGTQWQVGAAGNVIWTGVPLSRVVEALGGVSRGANFITGTGGESIPEGIDRLDVLVERSVPIAVLDRVMLAWELNGEPISLAHGGPLRMIVPGYTGVNNVKYVNRVAFTEAETEARIQSTRYRLQPVGEDGGPEHPSVWEMNVKSFITTPLESAAAGPVPVAGFAFSGGHGVEGVEVSVDGGATWQAATLVGPDMGPYAWRTFVLQADLPAGTHRLVSRATDTAGNVQPETVEPNDAGYNHNGWAAHGVDVTVG